MLEGYTRVVRKCAGTDKVDITTVSQLKVGDSIFDCSGKPHNITELYTDKSPKELYMVTTKDNRFTVVPHNTMFLTSDDRVYSLDMLREGTTLFNVESGLGARGIETVVIENCAEMLAKAYMTYFVDNFNETFYSLLEEHKLYEMDYTSCRNFWSKFCSVANISSPSDIDDKFVSLKRFMLCVVKSCSYNEVVLEIDSVKKLDVTSNGFVFYKIVTEDDEVVVPDGDFFFPVIL